MVEALSKTGSDLVRLIIPFFIPGFKIENLMTSLILRTARDSVKLD